MRRSCIFGSTVILFTALSFFSACTHKPISVSSTEIALGTYVKITIVTEKNSVEETKRIISNAYDMIKTYENQFDYRSPDGALARFNESVSISKEDNDELYSLLHDSVIYAQKTNGYFDPTVLPIVKLWGFDSHSPHLPSKEEIEKTVELVGYEKVTLTENSIRKPRSVEFDLSGIAKGKIVDLIRDYLKGSGYMSFLIDAGGDIWVSGMNGDKKKWRVAIQDPVHKDRYSGILEKTDTAIVTSGDYENFFIEGETKYSHLFNPRTGFPASDSKSVTILSDETVFGDAVSTAVFVMGSKRGYRFLMDNGIEGFIIYETDKGKIESLSTPGFWD